jgi:hypothetical protein
MKTEEILRYEREWEAMRRALGTAFLTFDFVPARKAGGGEVGPGRGTPEGEGADSDPPVGMRAGADHARER